MSLQNSINNTSDGFDNESSSARNKQVQCLKRKCMRSGRRKDYPHLFRRIRLHQPTRFKEIHFSEVSLVLIAHTAIHN